MANFSVQLPDANGLVPAPVLEVGPSPLVPILNTISQGVSQFGQDMKERAAKKKEDAKAKKEAREQDAGGFIVDKLLQANAVEGNEQAVDPFLDFATGTPPAGNLSPGGGNEAGPVGTLDPAGAVVESALASGSIDQATVSELAESVKGDAEAYQNTQTSVEQGTLPSTAQRAHVDRIVQETRARFPDVDATVILAVLEKAGVKSHLFRYLGKDIDDFNAREKGRRDFMAKAQEKGMEVLGSKAAGLEDSQVIAAGWEALRLEGELEATKTSLEIAKSQADLSEKQMEQANREAADGMRSVMTQQFYHKMTPFIKSVNEIIGMMPEAGANPALEERFQIAMDEMNTHMQIVKEQMRAEVLAHPAGSPELADKIVGQFEESYKNTVLAPIENRDKRTANLLKKLEDRVGLNMTQAYPFISAMKQLGISMQLTDVLIETADGPTRDRIAREIGKLSGFNMYDLIERNSGMLQVAEISSILMGNKTLKQLDISPQQASQIFQHVNKTVKELRNQLDGGDYSEAPAYLNGMAEVAVAAGELSPTANWKALVNASSSLGGASARVLVNLANGKGGDSVDQEYAQAIALGSRAGMANVLNGLKMKNRKFGFHSVDYNEKSLKWEISFNRKAWEASPGARGAVGDPMDRKLGIRPPLGRPPEVPAEARAMSTALNNAQSFLVQTASLDEATPQGLNEKELSMWYSANKIPKKVQEEMAQQEKQSKATPANILKGIESFRNNIRELGFDFDIPAIMNAEGTPVDATGNASMTGASSAFAEAAQAEGFSPHVVAGILANVQHESSFDPARSGDNGTAHGYFQHRLDRVDNFVEVTGTHPSQATPQQAVQFFKWELDNPSKAGMTAAQANEIKNAKDAKEAAMLIQKYYERPLKVDPARGKTAGLYYNTLFGS